MPGLSVGAYVAWQYAAGEAAEAGHPYIEARHMFLGILSLEKALADRQGSELRWNERESLRVEADLIGQILTRLGLEVTKVRRSFRESIGRGSHFHAGDVVHRSQKCRAIFAQAQALAGQEKMATSLHLLVMIAQDNQDNMAHLLRGVGVMPGEVAELAQSYTGYAEPKPQPIAPPGGRGRRPKARIGRRKNG